MRIDGVPAWLDLLYPLIDGAVVQLDRAGTTRVSAQTMSLVLPGDQHKVVRVDGFEFGRDDGG